MIIDYRTLDPYRHSSETVVNEDLREDTCVHAGARSNQQSVPKGDISDAALNAKASDSMRRCQRSAARLLDLRGKAVDLGQRFSTHHSDKEDKKHICFSTRHLTRAVLVKKKKKKTLLSLTPTEKKKSLHFFLVV